MKKNTAPAPTGTAMKKQKPSVPPRKHKEPTKWALGLFYLAQHPLFELEALSLYGDTCLHTTVSDLQKRFGLVFHREWVTHHHQRGGKTRFKRFTLAQESREHAAALLEPYGLSVALPDQQTATD
jgi:hypothetical protein